MLQDSVSVAAVLRFFCFEFLWGFCLYLSTYLAMSSRRFRAYANIFARQRGKPCCEEAAQGLLFDKTNTPLL